MVGFFASAMYIVSCEITSKDLKENLGLLYLLLGVGGVGTSFFYALYWKYILMPYSLNFHSIFSHNTLIEVRNKRTLFLDFFIRKYNIKSKSVIEKIYTKELKRFILEYQNLVSIDIDTYRKNKEKILHYLGLINKGYELSIYPLKSKMVQLSFYKLPKHYEVDMSILKKNKIFLGIFENGFYYRDIDTLDHHLVVGESGSGKSNFMQLLNINFIYNSNRFKQIYMIDLKGGVELKEYEKLNNIEFVSDIKRLDSLLDTILEDLKATQDLMLQNNIRKYDSYTLIIFDEIGAVSVYPDKKIRESIFNKLALIAMQGRSSGHLLFLFGQKIDNTILPSNIVNNLQSRVLLKTSNDNNINIIDLKDNIRERITTAEIQDFNKGRAIYKEGLTSEKVLMQFPYISDSFISTFIKFYS
jgi:S-DNA-T family DNA segregation ATPase FtsK/SpoIIIE